MTNTPYATIVIPTFKRSDALRETLTALAAVDYPRNRWEAIVVDDGSGDDTEKVVADWITSTGLSGGFIAQKNSGPAVARNRGASEAHGEVLIFIDNDILVDRDFIRAHVDALAANPGCWIVGRVVHPPELRRTPFGRYRDAAWEAFHRTHSTEIPAETSGMSAANVSMPSADFHKLGGFDEDFTIASCEDCDLGIRARKMGIRVLYEPRIVVLHNDWAVSLDRFCERQKLYSISDALLWRKYGADSPKADLVRQNSPINWSHDSPGLVLKKALKKMLATRPAVALTRTACRVAERIRPDSTLTKRAYDTAVGIAIFQGVREGLRRYPAIVNKQLPAPNNMPASARNKRAVFHLIDANLDTSYFRSIARHHDHDRFPVAIGSMVPPGPLQRSMNEIGVPTFSLGAAKRRQYPMAALRLARILRGEGAVILHSHCFDATFVGLIAARLAGVPFVFTRHHSDHNVRLGKRWHTKIDSWCARQANHVIAVSVATRRVMTDVESVPEDRITVVYNGMESLHPPSESDIEKTRREFGVKDEIVCLMLGRLHEEKGHRVLFDAIPEIQLRAGKVIFLLAGDGPHRSMLEQDVRARGLENSVRFLGRRDDVAELISLSSLVVLPSLAESFGFVVLEAMSLERPVVAAATGGIPEIVSDGVNGLLVKPGDSHALASAITRVINDPELARALASRGKANVARFSFERMIRGYEGLYARVLASTPNERLDARPSPKSARSKTIAG